MNHFLVIYRGRSFGDSETVGCTSSPEVILPTAELILKRLTQVAGLDDLVFREKFDGRRRLLELVVAELREGASRGRG